MKTIVCLNPKWVPKNLLRPGLFVAGLLSATLLSAQNVGIGTTTMPFGKLEVHNDVDANSSAIYAISPQLTGTRFGVSSFIKSGTGSAIQGTTMDGGGGTGGYEEGHYGVTGISGQTGIGVGAFTIGGVGLRASSGLFGLALYTSGKLKMEYIGEAEGYVLTSDDQGNATWKSLTGTHNHYGENWAGEAATGLSVSTTLADGYGLRGFASNAVSGTGVSGWSAGANGSGVLGISSPGGNYHPLPGDESAGVMGVSGTGTGVYAAATAGTSLHAVKLNFGISAGSVGIFENQKTGLTTPVVLISGVSNQPALELANGYLKVSGTTKTVFQVVTGSGGSTVTTNRVRFTYPGASSNDILIATHKFTSSYLGAVGVWWEPLENTWTIYLEDNTKVMPVGEIFNVLVVKQ